MDPGGRAGPPGDLRLGTQLRPVVYGDTAARAVFHDDWPPELILGVTARDEMIGYVIYDRLLPAPAYGGVSLAMGLSVAYGRSLAAATAIQLGLLGIDRGVHHSVLLAKPGASTATAARRVAEFRRALSPLLEQGSIEIAFERAPDVLAPPIAQESLGASTKGALLAAAGRIGLDPQRSSFATVGGSASAQLGEELALLGLRRADTASGAATDVVVAAAGGAPLHVRSAVLRGARVLLAVEPGAVSSDVERKVGRSGIVIPEALSGAGPAAVHDLVAQGLEERDALARAQEVVADLTAACLQEAEQTGTTLREAARRRGLAARGISPEPERRPSASAGRASRAPAQDPAPRTRR